MLKYIYIYTYWWVSPSTFTLISVGVNLKCIDDDAAQESANDPKLHTFVAKHKSNIYSEHLWWLSFNLELTPTQICDVTWNPRIKEIPKRLGFLSLPYKVYCYIKLSTEWNLNYFIQLSSFITLLICLSLRSSFKYSSCNLACKTKYYSMLLIGGGGGYIFTHSFFARQLSFKLIDLNLIWKETLREEHEFMNMQPPLLNPNPQLTC